MKKNVKNFWILVIVISILGTIGVAFLESIFGTENVFLVSTIIVFLCGLYVIAKQTINHVRG